MAPFLGGMYTKAAPQTQADSIARATGGSPSASYGAFGLGPVGPWDIDFAVKNALERVTWVFRPVDIIALNQSRLNIRLRKGKDSKSGEWVEDKRLWNLLNVRPNSYEQAWQFRYRMSAIALLSRRGVFIEIVRNRLGEPVELHLLPPGVTQPIPDPKTFVSGYRVQRSDWQIDTLSPEQVLWIRIKPHPTDPYAQLTPLMAAGLAAETDWLAHIFNRNFLANDGRPGTVVSIQSLLNPIDAQEIKNRFSGGPLRAGEVTVIEATGIQIDDMSASPRDVQWDELMKMSKEELLIAFGVPESVSGNASGRTYDNADAEREGFWLDTMVPHCDAFANSFDTLTDDSYDDEVLAYDYSDVDVLQRAENKKREEIREEVEAGLATIDEYMIAKGLKPWDVPGTRALWNKFGIVIGQNPEDQKILDEMKPVIMPEPPEQPMLGVGGGAPAQVGPGQPRLQIGATLRQHPAMRARQIAAKSAKVIEHVDDQEGDLPG